MKSIIINKKEFRQIRFNKHYYVSADGDVYSTHSHKIIKKNVFKVKDKAYYRIDIRIGAKRKHFTIHRLVYDTWVQNIDSTIQVNHINDNGLDNRIENLYIGTQKDNIHDCISNNHRVGNVFYLTLYDKEKHQIISFCPASNFIEYSGHPNKSKSLNKFFNKHWFKLRYEIIEFKRINNLDEYKGVTTNRDECSDVG